MKNNKRTRAGFEKQYDPRLAGEVLHDYLENSNEPLAVAYREQSDDADEQGWHRNTELSVDLKTILRTDERLQAGKDYLGILRRDVECEDYYYDEHITFVETELRNTCKRNPHVFKGKYITVTRRDDGSVHPNFKPLKIDEDFSLEKYISSVANELLWALEGLIENG